MDIYTRQFVVRSKQDDLLREANDARLAVTTRDNPTQHVPVVVRLLRGLEQSVPRVQVRPSHRRYDRRTGGEPSVTGHMFHSVGA